MFNSEEKMKRVILESPYSGNVEENLKYAKRCMINSLMRGEAPIASHLLYTQFLDDSKENERKLGITAGLTWVPVADMSVIYVDRGITNGMVKGIAAAYAAKGYKSIEYRRLDPPPKPFYILLSGKRCSGKDTLAAFMAEFLGSASVYGFANAVKREYAESLSSDPKTVQIIYERLLTDYDFKQSHRLGLIEKGQNLKLEKGQDIWIKKLIDVVRQYDKTEIVIIPDMRFKCEFKYQDFTKFNSVKVRIKCSDEKRGERGFVYNEQVDTGPSECDLDDFGDDLFDYCITNDASIPSLKDITYEVVRSLALK